MINAVYIGIIVVLFGAFIWQRIRAGFWKRLYKQAVKFQGEIERFRTQEWPELIERKDK